MSYERLTAPERCEHCGCLLIAGHNCIHADPLGEKEARIAADEAAARKKRIKEIDSELGDIADEIAVLESTRSDLEDEKEKLLKGRKVTA